jgi:asparagine synthase (glutamine-hydrolysing)
MNAISGIVGRHPTEPNRLICAKMMTLLRRYAPDRSELWADETTAIGACYRLTNPEDGFGDLPLTASSDIILACDSRIDNRSELAHELDIRLSEDTGDSEFFLRAYRRWGSDLVTHVAGSYCVGIWDRRCEQLVLIRSRMGRRTLYCTHGSGWFAFATRPVCLFGPLGVCRSLNDEFVAAYLVGAPPAAGSTFYKRISALQPGASLTIPPFDSPQQSHQRFNSLAETRYSNDGDYVEHFLDLFQRAVSDRLRSRRRVGLFLSGGFDSASVGALAAPQLTKTGRSLLAYNDASQPATQVPLRGGTYINESPRVLALAAMYPDMCLNRVSPGTGFYLEEIDRIFDAAECPFPKPSNRIWWEAILSRASGDGVNVMLTGSPGNATISWKGSDLFARLIRRGQVRAAFREARACWPKKTFPGLLRGLYFRGVMPWLPGYMWLASHVALGNRRALQMMKTDPWLQYSAIHPDFARAAKLRDRATDLGWDFWLRARGDGRQQRIAALLSDPGNDLAYGYSALFGTELRDPAGDIRLAEYCLSVPEDQYLRAGNSKWLLRRAMADRLPVEILKGEGRGVQASDWFDRLYRARPQVQDRLQALQRSELARSILDLPRLLGLFDKMPSPHMQTAQTMTLYRGVLEQGLMVGSFVHWVDSRGGV